MINDRQHGIGNVVDANWLHLLLAEVGQVQAMRGRVDRHGQSAAQVATGAARGRLLDEQVVLIAEEWRWANDCCGWERLSHSDLRLRLVRP